MDPGVESGSKAALLHIPQTRVSAVTAASQVQTPGAALLATRPAWTPHTTWKGYHPLPAPQASTLAAFTSDPEERVPAGWIMADTGESETWPQVGWEVAGGGGWPGSKPRTQQALGAPLQFSSIQTPVQRQSSRTLSSTHLRDVRDSRCAASTTVRSRALFSPRRAALRPSPRPPGDGNPTPGPHRAPSGQAAPPLSLSHGSA